MVSRRTRSQGTIGTRLVEIERQIEAESASKRGNSSEDLRAAMEAVEARILLLESVNFRVGEDRPALEDAYPQVLSGQGAEVKDWDDAVLAGWYWGTGAAHSPAESNGWTVGTVFYHGSSGRIVQEVFDPGFSDFESDFSGWRRVRVDGSWSAWTEIKSGGAADLTGPWPKAATGVSLVSNVGFYTEDGKAQSEVSFSWNAVTQDTQNKPMVVDLYEVWVWRGTQTGYQRIATDLPSVRFDLATPGATHKAKVRSRGANGAWGAFSNEVTFVPEYPDEIPLPPTAPVVYSEIGQAVVRWDGFLMENGTPVAPIAGFRHVVVERAESSTGPWFVTGQPLADPGESTVPDTVGATVWFRLVAVNVLGIQSDPGAAASVVIKGITTPDLGEDVSDNIQDAHDKADQAQTDANAAASAAILAAAKITNSNRAPLPADGTPKSPGSLWYEYAGDKLVGIWLWDGAEWTRQYLRTEVIAPKAIDASKIADHVISAAQLHDSVNSTISGAVQDALDARETADEALGEVQKSIVDTINEYVLSDSYTSPPNASAPWDPDTPAWEPGQFVWLRQKTVSVDGTVSYSEPAPLTGSDGSPGEDAVLLRIYSSRGSSFKNNSISTVLSVTVFKGSLQITNITDLWEHFGSGAYIEWWWRRLDDSDFGVVSSSDPRISQAGFALTVSPSDVDEQTVFQAVLNT